MALTGDRYVGTYEGHTLELVRNNWNKTIKLSIDGAEAASTSCMFPGRFTLTGTLKHNGEPHTVVARSIPDRLALSKYSIEVDGNELSIAYEKPRGLLKAVFKAAGEGHLASVITVAAITLSLLATVGVIAALLLRELR